MKTFKVTVSFVLSLMLLFSIALPGAGNSTATAAPVIENMPTGAHEINEFDASTLAPAVLTPDLKITDDEGKLFADGSILFEIEGGSAAGEIIAIDSSTSFDIPDQGVVTTDGEFIYLTNNGETDIVGSVNSAANGKGQALKIDLSTPLVNGNFEVPVVNNIITGWDIERTNNSDYPDQIWLGTLASKTQDRAYESIVADGDQFKVTGPDDEYTYFTDVNYGTAYPSPGRAREGNEIKLQGPASGVSAGVYNDPISNNSYLRLGFSGGNVITANYGTAFIAQAVSNQPFKANAGDQLLLDLNAVGGEDDYEVYGFLVEADGTHHEIVYGRGKNLPWTTISTEIPVTGTFTFKFVVGSHDRTNGRALGAFMNVDNIRVLSKSITSEVVTAIAQMVTYENNTFRPLPGIVTNEGDGVLSSTRHIHVTVANSDGDTVLESSQVEIHLKGEEALKLVTVEIEDSNPELATLTFNVPITDDVEALDFTGFKFNGQQVEEVIAIAGKEAVVRLAAPVPPGLLTVDYDASTGNISSGQVATNLLGSLTAASNTPSPITVINEVVTLDLIRTTTIPEEPTLLKLKFNKPVNSEKLIAEEVIEGLTVGGQPVLFVEMLNDDEVLVRLPAEYEGGQPLAYNPAAKSFEDASNPNNPLGSIAGTELPIVSGKISDFNLTNGNDGDSISVRPGQNNDPEAQGYWAVVMNDVTEVAIDPVAYNDVETVKEVYFNGELVDPANGGWGNIGELAEGVNTLQVKVYDVETYEPESAGKPLEAYTITIIRATAKLGDLIPNTGSLKPEFNSEEEAYRLNVYSSSVKLTNTIIDPGATIEVSLNGAPAISAPSGMETDAIRLKLGKNIIVVHVVDSAGETRDYTLEVWRYEMSAPAPDVEIVPIDIVIGGNNEKDITKVEIVRTKNAEGKIIDTVSITPDKAEETVKKAIKANEDIARVVIPDPKDEEDELTVNIPVGTVKLLQDNAIDLEIYSDHALIRIPRSSLEDIKEDFYFKLVPVKNQSTRSEVEERALTAELVRQIAGGSEVEVVTRPMTIHTNLTSRPVTLTLPLSDVILPTDNEERQQYLNELWVYIEHSDGELELVKGTPTTLPDGKPGLEISISKFSHFTIVHVTENGEASEHQQYVNGYPDGTFKPENPITRAEFATMLARAGLVGEELGAGFPDVTDKHWAATTIKRVQASGLMQGYLDGEFKPNQQITRAEMATIAFNFLKLTEAANNIFPDVKESHWAKGIINAVATEGYMVGYDNGEYLPAKHTTRAEAVTLVNRLAKRGPLYGMNAPTWPDVPTTHWAYHDIEEASQYHLYSDRDNGGENIVVK